ncbi:MAG: hypothetical protein L0226_10370 [Acidobacteria bacterium]|nr:hypothetical protein [Acidobacteriota bacterium]
MCKEFSSAFLAFAFLSISGITTYAQDTKPVVFTTPSKVAIAKLRAGETDSISLRGRATFTLTAANIDDTITGTLVYSVPDDARQKLAQLTGKSLKAIPARFSKKDVIAKFQKGTACPVVHLVITATEIEVEGTSIQFDRIVLDINETRQEMSQLFCAWTRQINANRHRRGIIAAINRLITEE